MTAPVRIAVAGSGLIGRRPIEEIDAGSTAHLAAGSRPAQVPAVVAPGPAAAEVADRFGVPLYPSLRGLFDAEKPDGIILATPNQLHVDLGLECVAAGVPVLVEKPIGDTVQGATKLVEAAEAAGVPLLTGHHRNYSPIMATAREIVQSGVLGPI